MFSGIVQEVGEIERFVRKKDFVEMAVKTKGDFENFELGESIAVNGVCLTVRSEGKFSFTADLSSETLDRTSFKKAKQGDTVNLERALKPSQSISGHFVSGHVDRVGHIEKIDKKPGEIDYWFSFPKDLAPYMIEKGSVAVDGISLTVVECKPGLFSVSLIPFTLEHTNMGKRKIGDPVNIECDMIGKYVYKACETILGGKQAGRGEAMDLLKKTGFMSQGGSS